MEVAGWTLSDDKANFSRLPFSSKRLITSEDLIFFELSVDVAGKLVFLLAAPVFTELSVDVTGTVGSLLALVASAFAPLLLLALVTLVFVALLLLALVESAFVALLLLVTLVVSVFTALLEVLVVVTSADTGRPVTSIPNPSENNEIPITAQFLPHLYNL